MKKTIFCLCFLMVGTFVFGDTYVDIIGKIIAFSGNYPNPPTNRTQRNIDGLPRAYLEYGTFGIEGHHDVYVSSSQFSRLVPQIVNEVSEVYGKAKIRDFSTVVYYNWEKDNIEIELYCGPINGAILLTVYVYKN